MDTTFTILLILAWEFRYPQKRGAKKKGALKQRIEAPLHTCNRVSRKYYAEPVCYFIVSLVTKRIASKSSIFFVP